MSIFNTLDFWATRCGEDDSFGFESMIVADLTSSGNDLIVVGSFTGLLRVYQLCSDDENDRSFKPSNLLLEIQLSGPIIQIFAGRLVSGTRAFHIGVVLQTSICVYNFLSIPGSTDHGNQFELKLIYEHTLQHTNYTVVHGPFGGVKGRDFMCAISLDGTATFFEQETFVFQTQLPSFLLPSPIVYVEETDVFVTLSADWCIEGYRYQDLVNTAKKKVLPCWSYNLGESVQDMKSIKHHVQKEGFLVVLSERNLICFGVNGDLKFVKRLQYTPLCFCCYINESNNNLMILIVSDGCVLYIYEKKMLRWSARLPFLPISISRGNTSVNGSLVLLSDHGDLQCCYLGTKPSLFVAPPLENSVASFKNMQARLETLQKEIENFKDNNSDLLASTAVEHELSLYVTHSYDKSFNECQIDVCLVPSCPLSNVHVSFEAAVPFDIQPKTHALPVLCEETKLPAMMRISEHKDIVPTTLNLNIIICYSNDDVVRVIRRCKNIAPRFVLVPCSVIEDKCRFKISIEINKTPFPLTTVFQDFRDDSWLESSCNDAVVGLCLRYNVEKKGLVSLSKSNQGYELAANSLPFMRLVLSLLTWKCKNMKMGADKSTEELSFRCHSLPKDHLIECISRRVTVRNEIRDLQSFLEKLSAQFRLIQRRLLIKLKDKVDSNINAVQVLYQNTYDKLIDTIRTIENKQKDLISHGSELQSVMDLICDLIVINDASSAEKISQLRNALRFTEFESNVQDWEERTLANVTHLLCTTLATNNFGRDDLQRTTLSSDETVNDPSVLQNVIVNAFERVSGQFTQADKSEKSNRVVAPILEDDEYDEGFSSESVIMSIKTEKLLSKRQYLDMTENFPDESVDEI